MKKESKKFLPILKDTTKIPWGYKESDDPNLLDPIQEHLEYLEHAKKELLPHYSYRKVAEWLTKVSGVYISYSGLRKRLLAEEKNASEEKYQRKLKDKIEKAHRKVEHYSNRIGGTSSYIWQ